jgi:hypothetical protein
MADHFSSLPPYMAKAAVAVMTGRRPASGLLAMASGFSYSLC